MKVCDLLEQTQNRVYHAININRALNALQDNCLYGYTLHRWWPDGTFKTDNNREEYEKSSWLSGVSTTRNIRFANGWNDVIFVLDKDSIRNHYEMIPIDWGSTISREVKSPAFVRKEAEEFIVTKRHRVEYGDIPDADEYEIEHEADTKFWNILRNRPHGAVKSLDKILIEIKISTEFKLEDENRALLARFGKRLGVPVRG